MGCYAARLCSFLFYIDKSAQKLLCLNERVLEKVSLVILYISVLNEDQGLIQIKRL